MSSRRDARAGVPATPGGFPEELAAGPCIETWAGREPKPPGSYVGKPEHRAFSNWRRAVRAWALSSGWTDNPLDTHKAYDLARTKWPWSRDYLIETGQADRARYFDTGSPTTTDNPTNNRKASR